MEVITGAEREVAAEIAHRAMVSGWENAIKWAQREYDLAEHKIKNLLDEALEYNKKADAQGRIHELEDWRFERGETAQTARSAVS